MHISIGHYLSSIGGQTHTVQLKGLELPVLTWLSKLNSRIVKVETFEFFSWREKRGSRVKDQKSKTWGILEYSRAWISD